MGGAEYKSQYRLCGIVIKEGGGYSGVKGGVGGRWGHAVAGVFRFGWGSSDFSRGEKKPALCGLSFQGCAILGAGVTSWKP